MRAEAVRILDSESKSALIHAVCLNKISYISNLLPHSNINHTDRAGRTALHYAA
jgi:hypothetical protein